MLLAYIDETGINQKVENNFYKDCPYAIWVSVLVTDNKYFHLERMYYDLANKFLGIKDWQKEEKLHATDIWNSVNNKKKEHIVNYFEELFQLLAKLNLNIILGIQQKNPETNSAKIKKNELKKARYSLLHTLEHRLAEIDETAVLIADIEFKGKENYSGLQQLVLERTAWRYNPGKIIKPEIQPKFEFEYKSNFMLDQLHYVDSKDSLFISLVDHIAFILGRVFTQIYLLNFPKEGRPKPDINMVPISENTFNFFIHKCTLSYGYYSDKENDVTMGNFVDESNIYIPLNSRAANSIASNNLFTALIQNITPYK